MMERETGAVSAMSRDLDAACRPGPRHAPCSGCARPAGCGGQEDGHDQIAFLPIFGDAETPGLVDLGTECLHGGQVHREMQFTRD